MERKRIILGATEKELAEPRIYSTVGNKGNNLSESGIFYHFSDKLLGVDLYIYKNSWYGEKVKKFVVNPNKIDNKSINRKAIWMIYEWTDMPLQEFYERIGCNYKNGVPQKLSEMIRLKDETESDYNAMRNLMLTGRNELTYNEYVALRDSSEILWKEIKLLEIKIDSLEYLIDFFGLKAD